MATSPTLSIAGTRARAAALLATTATGTGSTDRRVVFIASSPGASSHDTRTWPHNWTPSTTGSNYRISETSPHTEYKLRMSRGQANWSDDPEDTNGIARQSQPGQSTQPTQPIQPPQPSSSTRACTPQHTDQHLPHTYGGFKFGLYGWRKRCLYSLVLGLMIMVILNLALTLWLLKVMEFSSEGMGSLKIVPGGIELRGQAAILDALIASSVRSRKGRNLVLESWSNFTASARARDGRLLARFTLSEDRVDCVSKGFRITDPRGGVLFSADRDQVVVGAATLKVTGVGGAVFRGSVQTPLVRAEPGHSLRLESATRALEIKAPERIVIESRAGEILASCLLDLTLQSIEGAIRLDAKSVFLKDLKVGTPVQRHSTREQQQQQQQQQQPRNGRSSSDQRESNIYQLCVCASGKLFLARPEGVCQADKTVC
ncbi:zeta-sarcoglycan isoform X2 [Microplitis mediator]|uniref:zeta-sarcoglycan isoform X2 n=1 Tax=Microplitis mediator TaxID=375433 RepID=UPI002553FA53|nr:zeta-sarcoglycan isoform X2 [Microplitis mediator]